MKNKDEELEEDCHFCDGAGTYECAACTGTGRSNAINEDIRKGVSACWTCNGRGEITCHHCTGTGKAL